MSWAVRGPNFQSRKLYLIDVCGNFPISSGCLHLDKLGVGKGDELWCYRIWTLVPSHTLLASFHQPPTSLLHPPLLHLPLLRCLSPHIG